MNRVLIVFASSNGQTRAIADAIASRLRDHGSIVKVADAAHKVPSPSEYDVVILGSRVQYGRHARSLRRYIDRNQASLRDRPVYFFSVSMAAATSSATDPEGYIAKMISQSGLHPVRSIAFGGGLPYRQYSPLLRFVMKSISRRAGHTTDTSRDHDYTNWTRVAEFADEVARSLSRDQARQSMTIPS